MPGTYRKVLTHILKKHYKTLYGLAEYKRQFESFKEEWESNHQPLDVIHPEIK